MTESDLSAPRRAEHHRWLTELTSIPTASGREAGVVRWIEAWVRERPRVALERDPVGNVIVSVRHDRPPGASAPIFFTAHLDHPAFVVDRVIGPGTVQATFRGGVMDAYFPNAPVALHTQEGERLRAVVSGQTEEGGGAGGLKSYLVELEHDAGPVRPGDIGTWDLENARVRDGLLHAPACDDLAAAAAALAAFDTLLSDPEPRVGGTDVRLLFTRAEEIGFIGAIGACRHGTMPRGSRVLALENSRAFDDSPVGGGPIVRVGDRMSIFSPSLTGAAAAVAERLGGPQPKSTESLRDRPAWKWQRKLMPGGACEATVFCAAGYEATCLCLPLGNYHNMADLAAVQAGRNASPPRIAPEFIALDDFDGLVDLLVGCGRSLPAAAPIGARLEKLWAEGSFVLSES